MADQVTVTDAGLTPIPGITVSINNGRTDGDGKFSGTVTVADTVPPGTYTITVTETANASIKATASLLVTAKPSPSVTVAPTSVVQGGPAVTITGTGFHQSADVVSAVSN
ncbi:hypothetical protein GCM10020221_11270 [Streptomyces thioluteus]|uniref:IPT/TIG domain-containing protein n=1 Tax=Streptomyces thioluteus TaxID=66431 RepID=A0ABN3WIS9_STRTU